VISVPVHLLTYASAAKQVCSWAAAGESRYVCVSNVHMVMEAFDDEGFSSVLRKADLVTADGMPIVWSQRLLGHREAGRVYGPELMLRVCEVASATRLPVALYGGTEATLERLRTKLQTRIPDLEIAFALSPPFRPLTPQEDDDIIQRIRRSGARIVLVGMGCPKQELWMAAHRPAIPAVMLGVGAAFDFIAGTKPQAPQWMQDAGLEWSFRLWTEPRRLWRRYLYHNPRFVFQLVRQLVLARRLGVSESRG
jgi:N-acetylglucosaminyldiphosphoundecaprenol N-acetyl-beta-D-mannosaminyltransferase